MRLHLRQVAPVKANQAFETRMVQTFLWDTFATLKAIRSLSTPMILKNLAETTEGRGSVRKTDMPYIVHGAPGSGSGIVEAVCAELGVDYLTHNLDARNNEHRHAAYGALNPHHKMPTLELPDGEVLTESAAIVLTLDERHRESGILPRPGSKARAQALRWLVFCVSELYPVIELIDYPQRFTEAGGIGTLRARAREIWKSRWQVLERHIAGSPYLLVDGFCATDLFISHLSRWDLPKDWRLEYLPRIAALADAVSERPRLASVYARHFPAQVT